MNILESDKPNIFFLKDPNSDPDLDPIEDNISNRVFSNSPSSISSNSSHNSIKNTYQKLTFEEVEHSLQKHYKQNHLFSEMDIIITYIKGQKHIYTQSFYITRQKVHLLVFPCLFITSAIMVVAPIIQQYPWSGYLLTGLNAILTLFISILNFWNLQHTLIQYNTCATHFDRLETSLIMTRNQLYLIEDDNVQRLNMIDKIRETENRMMEIKNAVSILIPTEIKVQTPIICNFDIFAFIHKLEQNYKTMIIHYKDVKNEIRYIMFKWKKDDNMEEHVDGDSIIEHKDTYYRSNLHQKKESERERLMYLLKEKETIKQQLLDHHIKYSKIEDEFTKEIHISEQNQHNFWFLISYYICFFQQKQKQYVITDDSLV
jgi:hypothetical protein